MTHWILIENEIKSARIAEQFCRSGMPGRMLVLPFDRTKEEWTATLRRLLGDESSLASSITVGNQVTEWGDIQKQVSAFRERDLLIILDVQLKNADSQEIQNVDLLLTGAPGNYWQGLLSDRTNDMVITTFETSQRNAADLVIRFGGQERIHRGKTIEGFGDSDQARELLDDAFAWLLHKQPSRLDGTQGLFALYSGCYGLNWDGWENSKDVPGKSFFGHDWLTINNSTHSTRVCEWLGVVHSSQSVGGLFTSKGFARGNASKRVAKDYVKQALSRLGVGIPVRFDCDELYLPLAPGIPFLSSLTELLDKLSHDNSEFKSRAPATDLTFFEEANSNYGVRIGLRNGGARSLVAQAQSGKLDGASGALLNLLRARSELAPAKQPWSSLFQAEMTSAPVSNMAAADEFVEVRWCV